MSTLVTRAGKGSPLTHNEVDANFTNLNTDKIQSGNTVAALTITALTTPSIKAADSAGLALKNSSGTTQMSMGAGGFDNLAINVPTNINGANAQIDISPTGTGHVHIKPTGTGSLEIAPTNVGTINNMTIGATTPRNASVVDLSVTGALSFDAAQGTAGQVLTSAGTGVTPTWTTPTTGTVTSVAATVPSFLSIAGSPITSSGTLAFTYSGTALPVANGGTGVTTSTGTGAVVLGTSPTITTPTIDKINTSVTNASLGAGNASIMKNRIINGAMVIDQRNAGASFTPTDQTYSLDRWKCRVSQASKYTVQQNAGSVTPPVGFTNYLGVTSSSAYSVTSSDYFTVQQIIEGYNFADLGWGTANAKTITISFWVRSSLTGTFGGALQPSSETRAYPFTYTISSANTWELKSITIAGDTSGTWLTTNGIGVYVNFGLGAGSSFSGTAGAWAASSTTVSATGAVSVVGTNGATWYITGVQLEVGSNATGFEYLNYQTSLANCQRYYTFENGSLGGTSFFSGDVTISGPYYANVFFKQSMRTAPTVVLTNSTNSNFGATVGTPYPTVTGFIENRLASATGIGYFVSTWTASAEL